ncbi:MAG: DUF5985 family protein [Acidobacteriota bacterium]
MVDFLMGAIMMAYFISGFFFLRFWYETRERLFIIFALAFWVLTVNQLGFVILNLLNETNSYLYIVRLIAFILILIAIIDKNRSEK